MRDDRAELVEMLRSLSLAKHVFRASPGGPEFYLSDLARRVLPLVEPVEIRDERGARVRFPALAEGLARWVDDPAPKLAPLVVTLTPEDYRPYDAARLDILDDLAGAEIRGGIPPTVVIGFLHITAGGRSYGARLSLPIMPFREFDSTAFHRLDDLHRRLVDEMRSGPRSRRGIGSDNVGYVQ